jgi:hypothetical protein
MAETAMGGCGCLRNDASLWEKPLRVIGSSLRSCGSDLS